MHGFSSAQHAGTQTVTDLVQQLHGSFRQSVTFTSLGGAGLQHTGAGSQQVGAGAGAQQAGAGSQQSFLWQSPALAVDANNRPTATAAAATSFFDIGGLRFGKLVK